MFVATKVDISDETLQQNPVSQNIVFFECSVSVETLCL